MVVTSYRRQIMTATLLAFAAGGGIVRWLAPNPSLARDIGSLLLILWLPIIGNIIAFVVGKARNRGQVLAAFASDRPFTSQALLEITLRAADVPSAARPLGAGLFQCSLVLGYEAFTVRLSVPAGAEPRPQQHCTLEAEFLRPDLALPRFPEGTTFILLSGRTALGEGRVVKQSV